MNRTPAAIADDLDELYQSAPMGPAILREAAAEVTPVVSGQVSRLFQLAGGANPIRGPKKLYSV
jgi:hypothetical protein